MSVTLGFCSKGEDVHHLTWYSDLHSYFSSITYTYTAIGNWASFLPDIGQTFGADPFNVSELSSHGDGSIEWTEIMMTN